LANAKLNRPHKFSQLVPISLITREPTLCFKDDAWLSGATDGDGCFSFSLLSNSNAFRIRYIIGFKNIFKHSPHPVLNHIHNHFFNSDGMIDKNTKKIYRTKSKWS
jgi:hypothetical protein